MHRTFTNFGWYVLKHMWCTVYFLNFTIQQMTLNNENKGKRFSWTLNLSMWWHTIPNIYLTIRIQARNLYRLTIEIKSNSNCFSKNIWRKNKRTTLFDKQLLNLFKQPMLVIHMRPFVKWNCQIVNSNSFFSYLRYFLYTIFLLF